MNRGRAARLGQDLCLAGAALGALGLVAWLAGLRRLTTLLPGAPPMMPNTAVGLVLIGCAAALRRRPDAGPSRLVPSVLGALGVLAIGVATLSEYAARIDLHVDQLLVRTGLGPFPGRPSPPTALALLMLAAAVLLIDVRPRARARPAEWLALAASLIAFTAIMGLLCGAGPILPMHRSPVVGVAPGTAASLLLTSTGLLLERPEAGLMRIATAPGPGGMLLRRLTLPAILTPMLLGLAASRLRLALSVEALPLIVAIVASSMTVVGLVLLTITAARLDDTYEALESSRRRARELVEQAPDGVFVADLEGRYTDVNGAACRLLGYRRDELIGTPIVDLLRPEDVPRLWRAREQLLVSGPQVSEWSLRRKDGTWVPVEVSAKILADGRWQAFARDITEKKRNETAQRFLAEIGPVLTTSLDFEETLSRIAQIAVRQLADLCIVDLVEEDGELRRLRVVSRDASQAWLCELLEQGPLDPYRPLMGRAPLETRRTVLIQRLSEPDLDALAQSEAQRRAVRDLALQSAIAVPLVAHERLIGVVCLLSATASRVYGPEDVALAEELAHRAALAVENARLYRAAQRALKVRDDVLGIVAHDLRNPLAAILVQAGLLRQRGPAAEGGPRRPSDAILRAATRMNRLIQDLLDVTRMEGGRLPVQPARLPAAPVVADAIDMQRALASAASLDLRVEVAPGLPDLWADRDRLLQVFENLLGNAVKFTPRGGCITVGATARGDEVLFWVRDTGIGISLEDQAHVFDMFWQARTARRGAGLGLPIVRGIVEAHGGRVWVDSRPEGGSTFFFTLPAAGGAAASQAAPAPRGV